jgi:hypothetical protein
MLADSAARENRPPQTGTEAGEPRELEDGDIRRLHTAASLFVGDRERVAAVARQLKDGGLLLHSEVRGASMVGSLPAGRRIQIQCRHCDDLPLGAVVAFLGRKRIVVHRVAYRGRRGNARRYLLTQGDSQTIPDFPVEWVSILGPVIAVEHDGIWSAVPPARIARRRTLRRLLLWILAAALEVHPSLSAGLAISMWKARAVYRRGITALAGNGKPADPRPDIPFGGN